MSLPVRHLPHWSSGTSPAFHIKSTYLYSGFTPTAFLVKPPLESCGIPQAPVVALRRISSLLSRTQLLTCPPPLDGSGVDIFDLPFWRDALPRQGRSWSIIPSGRTSWVCMAMYILFTSLTLQQGLDWHGPSTADVWRCVEALEKLLSDEGLPWTLWSIPSNTRVVIIGHSNGGQGAWHITERFPDRVLAGKPSSCYMLYRLTPRHQLSPPLHSSNPRPTYL